MTRITAVLLAPLLFFAVPVESDTGVDLIGVVFGDLGYEPGGFGLQLDSDGRTGNWGYDVQLTALKHAKLTGSGYRLQAIGTARRFHGDWFAEAGLEWGGYNTTFDDGSVWNKFGHSPLVGVGYQDDRHEVAVRYFFPDSTFNNTTMFAISAETALNDRYVIGATVERWDFKIGTQRLDGMQAMLELGYRF